MPALTTIQKAKLAKAKKTMRAKHLYDSLYARLCRTWDSADACADLLELYKLTGAK